MPLHDIIKELQAEALSTGQKIQGSTCIWRVTKIPWWSVKSGTRWLGEKPHFPLQFSQWLEEILERRTLITKIEIVILSIGLASQNSYCLWRVHKILWWLVVVVFQWLGEGDPIPLSSIYIQQNKLVDFLVNFLGLLLISVGF